MAETAITAVLSKFGELASREAAVLLQVGDDIMLLRDRLEWLQAFIRDADRKRRVGADDLTRVWVRQTRDVAFEAEDALDEFFHKVDLESQGFRGWRIWRGYLASFMTQISVRHGLSGQIKRIKSRLDQISENQKEYNIEHTPSGIWTPATTAHVAWRDLQTVVGFEEDVKSLKELLLCGDHSPKMFISILGESGVGKNTLVKRICIDRDVRKTFRLLIAYSMPPDSSTEDLLKQVYNIACKRSDEHGASSQEEGTDIADKLRRLLANKKYLLILGGISSKTIVNCIAASLPDDGEGSRVVLTLEPESKEVAWHAANLNVKGVKSVHQLSRLDEERSGSLFHLRVFGSERDEMKGSAKEKDQKKGSAKEKDQKKGSAKEKEMERYEKDVYNITGGHPLAIVVLAGLLRSKEKPVEWDAVLQQLKPGMEEAQDGQLSNDKPVVEWEALQLLQQIMSPPAAREPAKLSNRMAIERIFSSSFDDLPQDLKSCFLYFAAYPKDITHHPDQIVRMWTAEGFIRPQKGKTMEQLGHSYLKELVSRCLVELEDKNSSGDIELVRVHNRILVFLQSEAREASFIEVHDRNDVLAPASVRRLSIQNDSGSYTTFTNKFPKLRSFICRVEEEVQSCGSAGQDKKQGQSSGSGTGSGSGSGSAGQDKKQGQSSGSGSGSAGQDKKQGQSSGSGSGSAGQDKKQGQSSQNYDLKFLCGSKFLRVLSVQGLNLTELPDEIGDMIHLRYLRVDCTHLKKLPCSIGKLLNLQTLDISKTNVKEIDKEFWLIKALRHVLANNLTLPVSVEMQELGELQTLHGVKLAQDKNEVQPCCVFSKTIKPAQGKTEEGRSPLDKMTKLRSLEMHGFKHEDAAALKSALGKMHLLEHLKLQGDGIPSCVFTEPSLRCLQTMVLVGTVECLENAALDIRKARPNLVSLKVPQEIRDELKKMNINPEILRSE